MGKPKLIYRNLSDFKPYLKRLVIDKESFEVQETNFTKQIKTDSFTIIFNEDAERDGNLLQLINMVRADSNAFDITKANEQLPEISWFDLTERPPQTIIAKVDIKSAYWETALKLGVVSEKTNQYLKANYAEGPELKKARLKALGSLATKKSFTTYDKGKIIAQSQTIQATKQTYMYVCGMVDDLMRKATFNIPGAFYYYWDCVFVGENTAKEVIDFVLNHNYGTKTELTQIDTFRFGEKDYLVSATDSKMYLVPQEKSFLLHV